MQQVCPIMSVATIELPKPGAIMVGGKPPEPQFVQCVGKACALFCPLHDEQGAVVGGGCAFALVPQAVMNLTHTIAEATLAGGADAEEGGAH